ARRRQHRPVRRDAPRHAGADAVHHHHPQPQDDGDCRPAVRGDDGGARRVEADFGSVELTSPRRRNIPCEGFPMNAGAYPVVTRAKQGYRPLVLLPLVALLAGCDLHLGNLAARATDEWTHTYPLKPGGEIEIDNTNGKIEVEGADTTSV